MINAPDIKQPMYEIFLTEYLKTSTLSEKTRRNYRFYVDAFYAWARKHGLDPEKATPVMLATWIDHHPKWSDSTKYTATTAMRGFFHHRFGLNSPLADFRVKRADPGPQRTMDEEETSALLSQIDTSTRKGIRDLAILTLMLETGLRAEEAASAELKRLDLRKGKLDVRIKGGRWGEAQFFDYTANALANWLAVRPFVAETDQPWIFLSVGGRTPGKKITYCAIRTILNDLAAKADIAHISPHVIRRTFATLMIENGAPTRLVQAAGRWKDIRMVEVYTRTVNVSKIEPYSPVKKLLQLPAEAAAKKR